MSIQFQLRRSDRTADELLEPYDEAMLSQIAAESPNMTRVEALERWFLRRLAERRLQPVEGDRPIIQRAFSADYTRGGAGRPVVIQVVQLREAPSDAEQDARLQEGRLLEEIEHGPCLWLVYDNEVNMLERLRAACKRGSYALHVWNLARHWQNPLPAGGLAAFQDPWAQGIDEALRFTSSDPTCLVLQDVLTRDDVLETSPSAALLSELVSRMAERPKMRLVVMQPDSEIPIRWRGLFRLIRLNTSQTGTPVLDALADDLTAQARLGKIHDVIGREKELNSVLDILNRAPGLPNSPLLIGKAGVGKTAIIEALAKLVVEGRVPRRFQDRRVMSLSATALGAGTHGQSGLESRLQSLIHELETHSQALIVFVDEIHTLMDVGGQGSPAAQALKASLGRGHISLIGATTDQEAVRVEEDPAFSRRFTRVVVAEPDEGQTIEIAMGWRKRLQEHHNLQVEIAPELIEQAVKEASWHIIDQSRPYSAISLLGQAASLAERQGDIELKSEHLMQALEISVGMKLTRPGEEEARHLDELETHLQHTILGQDEAITKVMRSVRGRRLVRSRKSQPFCMLFTGPSGVGKTEMAVQIGSQLFPGVKPIIYHMETYKSQHQVTDLLGSPPSYVGYDKGSRLVNDIRTRPRTVIIIDEVEKAHPDVVMALMGILDRGEYRDPRGIMGDFRHAYFLVTTNVVRSKKDLAIGEQDFEKLITDAFSNLGFPPEQVGRFGPKVRFQYLPKPVLAQIAANQLKNFATELYTDYEITLDYSDPTVLNGLADMASDDRLGARLITNQVTDLRGRAVEALDYRRPPRRMKVVLDRGQLGVRVIE